MMVMVVAAGKLLFFVRGCDDVGGAPTGIVEKIGDYGYLFRVVQGASDPTQ